MGYNNVWYGMGSLDDIEHTICGEKGWDRKGWEGVEVWGRGVGGVLCI